MEGYYYTKGTMLLTEYLKRIQVIRNASSDDAERKLLKLLSNSVIGKFFQKNIGIDIQKVQSYAFKHNIPFEEAINVKGVDFGEGEAKVGSCFYPEWYGLIVGKARATISEIGRDHNALVISSDSFVTDKELESPFIDNQITYSLKASGELVSYRTRFYRVGDKLAHHAVHNREAATEVLKEFIDGGKFKYGYYRFRHLRESWKRKYAFGSRTFLPNMTVDLGFDYKRKLNGNGETMPWESVQARQEFMAEVKSEKTA